MTKPTVIKIEYSFDESVNCVYRISYFLSNNLMLEETRHDGLFVDLYHGENGLCYHRVGIDNPKDFLSHFHYICDDYLPTYHPADVPKPARAANDKC